MTGFRILGMPDELRLEFEETTGIKTEAAQLIVEESVREAQQLFDTAIREVQAVIGPRGSVTRLQAGGINIAQNGINVFGDGVLKTSILSDGTFFVGSNIEQPANTSLAVFVKEQTYNSEAMGEGDLLIGDNSAANVKYDASEGQLQFRDGQTVQVYIDTDGTMKAGGGDVTLDQFGITFVNQEGAVSFDDTNGNPENIIIYSDGDNFLVLKNTFGNKGISFLIDSSQIDFTEEGISLQRGMELYLESGTTPLSAGWFPRSETWTRTGNHTFTVPGDLTAEYRKGMKVKYSDGSFEYGVIASSSHAAGTTTVNLIPNTDYAMSGNSTDNYLSPIANPEGFPRKFNFTPTVSASGGGTFGVAPTINSAYWSYAGDGFGFFYFDITINAIGTAAGTLQVTTPWTTNGGAGSGRENAVTGNMLQTQVGGTTINIFTYNNGAVLTATWRPACGVVIDLA